MTIAITPTTTAAAAPQKTPVAGLDALISRYEKQLADCVNCESSKTPQGQANIEAIATKIAQAKARIEQTTQEADASKREAAARITKDAQQANTARPALNSVLGTQVDVYV